MAKRERVMRMSVEQPLWRALTGYRVLTMVYAIGLFVSAYDEVAHPWVAISYFAVLAVWTLATLPRVANAASCTKRFLAADLTIALTGILLTRIAETHERIEAGAPTLPSIWTAGAVLAFAIKGGWRWAAFASTLVAAANLIHRSGVPTRDTVHMVLLVWIASIAIGYVVEVARASERTLARALEIEAATRERERLARDIHDGVLQVLAMVQRRGAVIGGEAAELGGWPASRRWRCAPWSPAAWYPCPGCRRTPPRAPSYGPWTSPTTPTVPSTCGCCSPGTPVRRSASPSRGRRCRWRRPPLGNWPRPSAPPWTTSASTPANRHARGSSSRTSPAR